jgi:hypothetical protein
MSTLPPDQSDTSDKIPADETPRGAEAENDRSRLRQLFGDGLRVVSVGLPIAAVIAYAVSYATLSRFYTELGSSPSEVGLDYRDILSRCAGLFLFFAVVTLLGIGIVIALGRKVFLRIALLGFAGYMFLIVGALNAYLGHEISVKYHDALAGLRVGPVFLGRLNLVQLHADPVLVCAEPSDPQNVPPPTLEVGPLLLLGESGGEAVLFSSRRNAAILIPLSDVTLLVRAIHVSTKATYSCR